MENNKYSFFVAGDDVSTRLDFFLSKNLDFMTRNQIQKIILNAQVKINGRTEKPSYKVKENEQIDVVLSEEMSLTIEKEDISLDIVYENDDLLVVNKPKNMLTHPTTKELSGTLVNALLYRYGYDGLSDVNGVLRPGIVHRLDRNTSGLLLVAKNNESHLYLAEGIKNKTILRQYIAVVNGVFAEEEGLIITPIGRSPNHPEKMAVVEGGKESVTEYKVLESFKRHSLVELTLKTGRTHQIRVHMAHIKHPVVNDSLYTGLKLKVHTTEQALQSYKLKFANFKNGDIINLCIDYDNDIQKVLSYLRSEK